MFQRTRQNPAMTIDVSPMAIAENLLLSAGRSGATLGFPAMAIDPEKFRLPLKMSFSWKFHIKWVEVKNSKPFPGSTWHVIMQSCRITWHTTWWPTFLNLSRVYIICIYITPISINIIMCNVFRLDMWTLDVTIFNLICSQEDLCNIDGHPWNIDGHRWKSLKSYRNERSSESVFRDGHRWNIDGHRWK